MIEEETKQGNRAGRKAAARMPLVFRLALLLLVAIGAAALYSAIRSGIRARVQAQAALAQETLDLAVPTVQGIHPQPSSAAEELVLPGNAQAFVATPIFARVNGYLKKWYCDIGTHVKAGQLLADIETPEIDQQLDQARADVATAQANYALALITAERYQNLFKTLSVAKQDVDNKVGDMQSKKTVVDSANSNLRRLQETQRFQKVYAPFEGVITARNIDIGALIDAGANSPGKEMFDLAATSRLRVYVNVPQSNSRSATVGRPAAADAGGDAGPDFHRADRAHRRGHRSGFPHAAHRSGRGQSHRRAASRRFRFRAFSPGLPAGRGRAAREHAYFPHRRLAGGGGAGR